MSGFGTDLCVDIDQLMPATGLGERNEAVEMTVHILTVENTAAFRALPETAEVTRHNRYQGQCPADVA